MPSTRRVKILLLAVALVVFSLLYLSSNARTSNQGFYDRTVAALNVKEAAKSQAEINRKTVVKAQADQTRLDEDVARKLKEKIDAKTETQKPLSNEKDGSDSKVSDEKKAPPEVKEEGGAAARKKGDKWNVGKGEVKEEVPEKTQEEKEVETELNSILKRSPIIIFSKSYCPHSKRAKHILLETYSIVPAPFVVELDLVPLGPALQAKLATMTGRKTVPNVLISGKSLGGGDEVTALHETGKMVERVTSWGGKRIQEVRLRDD